MGNLFEAMGRAQPVSAIQNFQSDKANIASQKNQLAVQNLQMENVQQQMDIRQNNFDTQLAKEKEGMTPVSTDQFTSSFYGGPDGAVAKWALKRGIDMGIINTISEGVTTITPDNAKKFRETLSKSPGMLSELNLVRINATKLAKDTAYDAWQKKPDDQTKAEYDKAMMEHNAAIGASSNLENYFKNQPKDTRTPDIKNFEYGQENPEFAAGQAKDGNKDLDRFKVVGGRLIDLSGDTPKVVIESVEKEAPETLLDKGFIKLDGKLIDISDPLKPKVVIESQNDSDYAPTKLTKLFDKLDSFPEGHERRKYYQQAIDNITSGGSPELERILAQRIIDGKLDFNKLSRRGKQKGRVAAWVAKIDPEFNLIDAEANIKYKTDSANLRSISLIEGIQPLFDNLIEKATKLNNTKLKVLNKAVNFAKLETGDKDLVAFNNLRDDVIAETERVLMGTGVLSDSKYMRALGNLNSAQSPEQMEAAIEQMMLVIQKREDALRKQPYPQNNKSGDTQVTTQEEYDALPSGTIYIENGNKFRKP